MSNDNDGNEYILSIFSVFLFVSFRSFDAIKIKDKSRKPLNGAPNDSKFESGLEERSGAVYVASSIAYNLFKYLMCIAI